MVKDMLVKCMVDEMYSWCHKTPGLHRLCSLTVYVYVAWSTGYPGNLVRNHLVKQICNLSYNPIPGGL